MFAKTSTLPLLLRACISSQLLNQFTTEFYNVTGAWANEVMQGFEKIKGFPRVLGAVDGCHIQIKAPQEKYHPLSYLNRKRDYSVILQVNI